PGPGPDLRLPACRGSSPAGMTALLWLRRDAPAAPRRLDAQPGSARRGVASDQGFGPRLALGRALVHAPARRRRRGEQQRQLAVVASVGVDRQPPFRRIYNPTRQQDRFDPDGAYVRRYVP